MKLMVIDFLPRCLGSLSDGTANCCYEYMSASGIKEFWKKIERSLCLHRREGYELFHAEEDP